MLYTSYQIEKLADIIVTECLTLTKGDCIVVEGVDVPSKTLVVFCDAIASKGYNPIILYKSNSIMVFNGNYGDREILEFQAEYELNLFKKAKALIGLREPVDLFELNNLTSAARKNILKHYVQPVHYSYRNKNLQWLYVRLPSATLLGTNEENVECKTEEYFNSIFISYQSFLREMDSLEKRLLNSIHVKITSEETNLEFELAGKGVYKSAGGRNLPDGEIFTSPLKNSLQGDVLFNIPSTFLGNHFENIKVTFEDGKAVRATASQHSNKLNELLDTDEGARYCGEFAFGLNPFITHPLNDILYDEKISGSFHFALGNSYPEADNGNRSAIHWDLIHDMRGRGSEIFLDGELIMQNGIFVAADLQNLNPNNLKLRLC